MAFRTLAAIRRQLNRVQWNSATKSIVGMALFAFASWLSIGSAIDRFPVFVYSFNSFSIDEVGVTALELEISIRLILLFAALVIAPLLLDLAVGGDAEKSARSIVRVAAMMLQPAAAALFISCTLPRVLSNVPEPNPFLAAMALPWFATTLVFAWIGIENIWRRGFQRPCFSPEFCIDAGLIFSAVGGAWTVADRLGFRPLDFQSIIVLLTAMHFHYAGLTMSILAGLAWRERPGPSGRLACGLVVIGTPLVAIGITATHLGMHPAIETFAAWTMAVGGTAVGILHLQLAFQSKAEQLPRLCWFVAGASLLFSMTFAALYGTRYFANLAWLDIPLMTKLHGFANAFGFALCGTIGWAIAKR